MISTGSRGTLGAPQKNMLRESGERGAQIACDHAAQGR